MNAVHLFLSELRIALRKSRSNRSLIKQIDMYLLPGKYFNTPSFDCIYNSDRPSHFWDVTFFSKNKYTILSGKLIRIYNRLVGYNVRNEGLKCFQGSEVIISSSQTEYKVFDFAKRLVLTIYQTPQKLKLIQLNKDKFKNAFLTPNTLTINENQLFTIEELILHQKYSIHEAFCCLTKSISAFLKDNADKVFRDTSAYLKACDLFASRFGNSVLLKSPIGEIKCLTHGDLWSSNLIFDGESYYLTDFERVGVRFFLYDAFTFMFTEWLVNGDSCLLDSFFSGEYDMQFEEMFYSIRAVYNSERRQEYFLAFLVSITDERWRQYFGIDKMIRELINQYIPTYTHDV